MIVFATSLLKGDAQDWWVHLRDKYWYVLPYNGTVEDLMASPRYQYPSWEEFCDEFTQQFCDPATEEWHEACMKEMGMGNTLATAYFWALE